MSRRVVEAPEIRLGVEDEAAVIGAALAHQPTRRRAVAMLKPEDFFDDKHRVLFVVATEMNRCNLAWSEDAVASIHSRREDWGGFEYLRLLIENYGRELPNLEYHVERIKLTGLKRFLLGDGAARLVEIAENPRSSAEQVIEFGQQVVARAATFSAVRRYDWQQATSETWSAFKRREKSKIERVGFCCPAMDSVFSFGLAPGRCSVLGAAPGAGKTTFAVALARRRLEQDPPLGTCYIACEMSDQTEIPLMMAAATLRIPFLKLLRATELTSEERAKLREHLEQFHAAGADAFEIVLDPFSYDDESLRGEIDGKRKLWPGDLNRRNLATFESIVASTKHKLVVLDMVGHALIEEDVQLLNRGLLAIEKIAKRHAVHILLLHHLNRGDTRVKNPRPTMRSFRGASGFENYMHNVMVAYRPRGAKRDYDVKSGKDTFEVALAKQKVGAEAIVLYDYEAEFMDFTNGRIHQRGNAAAQAANDDGGEYGLADIGSKY